MMIDLTEAEIKTIGEWYFSAADEGATDRDKAMFSLIEKLDIHAHIRDLRLTDPTGYMVESQAKIKLSNEVIMAYRHRHPEYAEVIKANRKPAYI